MRRSTLLSDEEPDINDDGDAEDSENAPEEIKELNFRYNRDPLEISGGLYEDLEKELEEDEDRSAPEEEEGYWDDLLDSYDDNSSYEDR